MFELITRHLRAIALTVVLAPSLACGNLDVPLNLALEEGSVIELGLPLFPPPNDVATTELVGGVGTTISVSLSLGNVLSFLSAQGILAMVTVDIIDIAGTALLIGGLIDTGTVCVSLDAANPGGGTALLRPILGQASFMADLNTEITVTTPGLIDLLGGPLPFSATIDADTPISFSDLLALVAGGSAGGITLSQEIMTTLPPDTPIVGAADISALLTLTTVDVLPTDVLLDECAAFLAGP